MALRLPKIIPSMYQRRLLLVLLGAGIAIGVPLVQVTVLTSVNGQELRATAESKLVTERWVRTIRGQIVDRKGRILAVDRASFDVVMDYPVLTGRWAFRRAAERARRLNPNWNELAPEQREELIDQHLRDYQARLEQAWETISMVSGVPRAELQERRDSILTHVRELAAHITESRRRSLEAELNRGEELLATDADGQRIEVRTSEVRQRIAEEQTAHTILSDVPDAVGFKMRQLAEMTIADSPGPALGGGAGGSGAGATSSTGDSALPGVRVLDAVRREYPLETIDVPMDLSSLPAPLRRIAGGGTRTVRVNGVATHLLGWVRERVTREDIERRDQERLARASATITDSKAGALPKLPADRGRYFPDDAVGAAGIEHAHEFDLRGTRGVQTRHLDTGEIDIAEPDNGRDLTLTIDAALQARVQALFDPSLGLAVAQPWHSKRQGDLDEAPGKAQDLPLGTPLNGAVVVLDIATGDVLVMASLPSFGRAALKGEPPEYWEDKYRTPAVNRATSKWYTPGSIVKPLVLCAAHSSGKLGIDERISCTGHYFPDKPLLYRCWIYKQFNTTHDDRLGHAPDGTEAVAGSCNIFFFELGRRLGTRGINDWYTRYGIGPASERWNLGIGQESPGSLPKDPSKSTLDEAILMGIGQGPIAWTPLHAADAYATIARGGVRILPRIRIDAPVRTLDIGLDPAGVRVALDGLYQSANGKNGTTYTMTVSGADGEPVRERIFNVPGITVWAKSGTADVAPFKSEVGTLGNPGLGAGVFDGDHAWCVSMAGVTKPEYAIAVVVDHGGSGGKCAGPIANQVIRALVAEGYLPSVSEPTTDEPPVEDEL